MTNINAYTVGFSGIEPGIEATANYAGGEAVILGTAEDLTEIPKAVLLDTIWPPQTESLIVYNGLLKCIGRPNRKTGNTGYIITDKNRAVPAGTCLLRLSTEEYPGTTIIPLGEDRKPLEVKFKQYNPSITDRARAVWVEGLHNLVPGKAVKVCAADAAYDHDIPGFVVLNESGKLIRKTLSEYHKLIGEMLAIRGQ